MRRLESARQSEGGRRERKTRPDGEIRRSELQRPTDKQEEENC